MKGLPYFAARNLTPAGIERLVEMLRDPAEAEHRENIVMALGIRGRFATWHAPSRGSFRETRRASPDARPYPAPSIANATMRMTDCTTHPIAHTPTARHVFV